MKEENKCLLVLKSMDQKDDADEGVGRLTFGSCRYDIDEWMRASDPMRGLILTAITATSLQPKQYGSLGMFKSDSRKIGEIRHCSSWLLSCCSLSYPLFQAFNHAHAYRGDALQGGLKQSALWQTLEGTELWLGTFSGVGHTSNSVSNRRCLKWEQLKITISQIMLLINWLLFSLLLGE